MDNVNILLSINTCRSCFISEAGIVQQNGSTWFQSESSSSMRFLVPRSRPLKWVIVKVQTYNQDSPDWVTVQQLLTAVPSEGPTALTFRRISCCSHCRGHVCVEISECVRISFHKPLCSKKTGTFCLGSWTEVTGIHSLSPFGYQCKMWFTKSSGSCINGCLQETSALEATHCSPLAADLTLRQKANIIVKHSVNFHLVNFWKRAWVMLMSRCWYAILAMIVSGMLDWCNWQARSHHRNHQAFN